MGGQGFISCLDKFIKSFFYGREIGFVGDVRECLWFVSHNEVEWRFAGGRVGSDVMDEFCHGYLFSPFGRIRSTEYLEISFDFLVDSFGFSISLWVVGG